MSADVYTGSMAEIRVRNVPDILHRELKSRAALQGLSLNELIIQLLQEGIGKAKRK